MFSLVTKTRPALERVVFVVLVTAIAVVGSERFFWFWSPSVPEFGVGVMFYAIAVAATLWSVQTYRVTGNWSLLLVVPLYAYLTEGLLTPVLYSGGPFIPFFPVWFTGWHGVLSIYVLVFVVRRLLLAHDWKRLLVLSTILGAFWGVWSSTLRLPENAEDEEMVADVGELIVLDPAAFVQYVATYTAILGLAHLLLSAVWPTSFVPGRLSTRLIGALIVIGVVAWSFVIPWALPMFVAYVALQVWALRSHRATASGPNLFSQLRGSFPIWMLLPFAALAGSAAGSYALLWQLDPSDDILRVIMFGTIAVQTVVAAILMFRSIHRARKNNRPEGVDQLEQTQDTPNHGANVRSSSAGDETTNFLLKALVAES